MNSLAGSKSVEKKWESRRQRIARKHNGVHSRESFPATINRLANVLSAILKQYNGFPTPRIRPQSFNICGHFFQSCISFGNPTILSSEIQASAYDEKRYHTNSSEAKKKKISRKETYIATSRRLTR
jgi:hypothetical protein